MARIKMTEEERAAKLAERKEAARAKAALARQEKNRQRQAAWDARVAEAKEATLKLMSDADQAIFLSLVDKYMQPNNGFSSIEVSILGQYRVYGKLTEAQIKVVLNKHRDTKMLEIQQNFFDDFEVNTRYDLQLKLISHQVEHCTANSYFAPDYVNVFRFENDVHQVFKIKTNSKKLIAAFSETGKWYSLNALVTFIAPNNKFICLKPSGIKLA